MNNPEFVTTLGPLLSFVVFFGYLNELKTNYYFSFMLLSSAKVFALILSFHLSFTCFLCLQKWYHISSCQIMERWLTKEVETVRVHLRLWKEGRPWPVDNLWLLELIISASYLYMLHHPLQPKATFYFVSKCTQVEVFRAYLQDIYNGFIWCLYRRISHIHERILYIHSIFSL